MNPRTQLLTHLNSAYLLAMRTDGDYSDCRGCGFRSPKDPRGHSPTCPVAQLADLISRIEEDPEALNHADDPAPVT